MEDAPLLIDDILLYIGPFCTPATRVMLSSTNRLLREHLKPLTVRDADIPELLTFKLDELSFSFLDLVIDDGSFELLKYLHELQYPWGSLTISKVGDSHNTDIVKWAWGRRVLMRLQTGNGGFRTVYSTLDESTIDVVKCVEAAAKRGDLEMVKWWKNASRNVRPEVIEDRARKDAKLWGDRGPVPGLLVYAAESGSCELIQWLLDEGYTMSAGADLQAAKKGHFNVLELLYTLSSGRVSYSARVIEYADDINVVKWLLDHGAPLPRTCGAACATGKKEIVELLRARNVRFSKDSFALAGKKGSIEFLEWLLENRCPFNQDIVDVAVKANRLDVLQWLHARGYDVKVTKQLKTNFQDLYDYASKFAPGAKEASRRSVLSEFLMLDVTLLAAKYGSVEMLQWLFDIGLGISFEATAAAARGGKLEILQWLHTKRYYALYSDLIFEAFPEHPEVVRWLRKQGVAWPVE